MEPTKDCDERLSALEARVEALELALRRRKAPAEKLSPSDFLALKISEGHLGSQFSEADIRRQRWPNLKTMRDVFAAARVLALQDPPLIERIVGKSDRYTVCVEVPPRPVTAAEQIVASRGPRRSG